MIKDDIIDELIPSENFGDFTYPSFTDFDALNKKFICLPNTFKQLLPENLVLDLKL